MARRGKATNGRIPSRKGESSAALPSGDASPSWDLIRAFLALDRYGDYEAAATKEAIDDSTLRRRIRSLEEKFRRSLFVRSEGRWKAAPDLDELVRAALRMEEAARSFAREGRQGSGTIRVSMLDVFAERFGHVFSTIQEKHPHLTFRFTTEFHLANLEQDQVDIAIRLARPVRKARDLWMRRLGDVPLNAYAHEDYLRRTPAAPSAEHRLLALNTGFSHHDHEFPYATLSWGDFGLRGEVFMQADNLSVLARLCRLGLGVAILPTWLAEEQEGLRVVDDRRRAPRHKLWMVSRFDLKAGWQRELGAMLQDELARWER